MSRLELAWNLRAPAVMTHVGSRESEFSINQKHITTLLNHLNLLGLWLGQLRLRLLLGWDLLESGMEKFKGSNWFMDIQDRFSFPFSFVPPEISWQMATWFELLGGIALVLGLATRFF